MPFSGGMVRKLSTCSLPAALLMEQAALTPSSSYECFSPTGSTCSLDQYGHTSTGRGGARTLTSGHHRQRQHHSTHEVRLKEEVTPTSALFLANGIPPGGGGGGGGGGRGGGGAGGSGSVTSPLEKTSMSCDLNRPSDQSASQRTTGTLKSLAARPPGSHTAQKTTPTSAKSTSSHNTSGGGRGGVAPVSPALSNSSWADTGEEGGSVNKPDWALMPSANGESHSGTGTSQASHSDSGGASLPSQHSGGGAMSVTSHSDSGNVLLAHSGTGATTTTRTGMEPATGYHQHQLSHPSTTRASVSAPHTPIHHTHHHQHHSHHAHHHTHHHSVVPGKRNPHHEGGPQGGGACDVVITNSSSSSDIVVPQPLHPVASAAHNKSYIYPSPITLIRTPTQQQQQPRLLHHGGVAHLHHNQNNSNGLMRAPPVVGHAHHNRLQHQLHLFPPGAHPGGVVSAAMQAYSGGGSPTMTGPGHHHHHHHHHLPQAAPPPPGPVMCYNCGKRGHLGSTCPGPTMDASDTSCEL